MTMNIHLLMTLRSPYARMVRVALLEKGISFTEENLDLARLPADFLEKNPAGTVPTLEIDGLVLTDSQQILHYLEEKFPAPALVADNCDKAYRAWHWVALANRLCEQNVSFFFELQKENPTPAVLNRAKTITDRISHAVDVQLTGQKYLALDYSMADIAMGSVMKWMAFRLHHSWTDLKSPAQTWLAALDKRNSFQKTQPRLG